LFIQLSDVHLRPGAEALQVQHQGSSPRLHENRVKRDKNQADDDERLIFLDTWRKKKDRLGGLSRH
jgi:hypothetical protein